jgi:hypothetical protein
MRVGEDEARGKRVLAAGAKARPHAESAKGSAGIAGDGADGAGSREGGKVKEKLKIIQW